MECLGAFLRARGCAEHPGTPWPRGGLPGASYLCPSQMGKQRHSDAPRRPQPPALAPGRACASSGRGRRVPRAGALRHRGRSPGSRRLLRALSAVCCRPRLSLSGPHVASSPGHVPGSEGTGVPAPARLRGHLSVVFLGISGCVCVQGLSSQSRRAPSPEPGQAPGRHGQGFPGPSPPPTQDLPFVQAATSASGPQHPFQQEAHLH